MTKLFYIGIIGFILFEIAKVYFIMPMPGSQKMETLDIAFFLHSWRWIFRSVFGLCVIIGLPWAWRRSRVLGRIASVICLLLVGAAFYMFNFKMKADRMFYQPHNLVLEPASGNTIPEEKLVLGYVQDTVARAYPIQLIAYHHQVLDTVDGEPVMVTYCSVCRSGRIFKPEIDGKPSMFRLVGMDHFNAMFEDNHTKSWWQQATGKAIAGEFKGKMLPELQSEQMTLSQWLELYPHSLIMQYDTTFQEQYDSLDTYDIGIGRGKLTGTDTLSWNEKSWVIGISTREKSKAYDWNALKDKRIINDTIGSLPLMIVLYPDSQSFSVYERPSSEMLFILLEDTISSGVVKYDLYGNALTPDYPALKNVQAYQEFWHSWRTFHPGTARY